MTDTSFPVLSMSYPTPNSTPERQPQSLVDSEPLPQSSPSTPSRSRALGVLSSPIKLLWGLDHPTSGLSAVSPPQSLHPDSHVDGDEEEAQDPAPSRHGSESDFEESSAQSLLERALAPFRSSRQRQEARLRRVRNLISLIEKFKNEGYLGDREAIPKQLFPKDYIELLVEVNKRDSDFQHYFNHHFRYEYRESRYGTNQFTIYMLSAFHISIQGSIDHAVVSWIDRVKGNSDNAVEVKTAAGKVRNARDTNIKVENKSLRPDCSFKYRGTKSYPPIAFEIAWSQSTDDLNKRAIELIEETAGQIRTVVGFDFSETRKIWSIIRGHSGTEELPGRGPATAFIWRAMFDENGQQLFRADGSPRVQKRSYKFCNGDGNIQPRAKLQLSLRDFIPLQVILAEEWGDLESLDNTKLELNSATIVGFFDDALDAQREEDETNEPEIEAKAQKNLEIAQRQAARRRAAAEKQLLQRLVLNIVTVGGRDLRGGVRKK